MKRLYPALGASLLGLLLWQAVVSLAQMPAFILPSPWRVAQAIWVNRLLLIEHASVTLQEVVIGLLIGSLLGIATAILLARSARLSRVVMPLLIFTQAVPVFALAPILTLWFGYGMASKVLMAVLIIFFPVTTAFYDGLTRIQPGILDLARTMNATPFQEMFRLRIPYALPSLATGLKMASVYAPIGAVIGEWVGASKGLGYLMLLANGRAKTDLMFATVLVLAMLTIALYLAVRRITDHLIWIE